MKPHTDIHSPAARTGMHHTLLAIIILALLLATGLAVTAASPAQAANITESEPNDTGATADALPLGDTISGKTYKNNASQDTDNFRIPVTTSGRLNIDLKFPANLSGAGYTVQVYEGSNKRFEIKLNGADSSGAWAANYAIYVKDTAYVVISGTSQQQTWNQTYTLRVTHTPGTVESEPNATLNQATTLPLGTTMRGASLVFASYDEDYFFVPINGRGRANIKLQFPANLSGAAYGVVVYDDKGNRRFEKDLLGSDSSGAWAANIALYVTGSIYVRIYGTENRPTWGKEYSLQVSFAPGNVEAEPNATMNSASTLALGTTIQGSSLGTGSYDEDYYFVPSTKALRAALDFRFPGRLSGNAYTVNIYDAQGNRLHEARLLGSHSAGAWGRKLAVKVPKGGLYIRVYGSQSSSTWGQPYTLRVQRALIGPKPKVKGKAVVGKTLKAKAGKWKPKPVKLSYRWYRNGKAIKKATKVKYKLKKADRGKKITVKVTAKKAGHFNTSKKSKAVKVKR